MGDLVELIGNVYFGVRTGSSYTLVCNVLSSVGLGFWALSSIQCYLNKSGMVIFCGPDIDQIRYIRMFLLVFEASSGLSVNWRKRSLLPIKGLLMFRVWLAFWGVGWRTCQMFTLAYLCGIDIRQWKSGKVSLRRKKISKMEGAISVFRG